MRKKKEEYISKSEVLLLIQNYIRAIQMNDYGDDRGISQLYNIMGKIDDLKQIKDIERVTRCKGCIHYDGVKCENGDIPMENSDFCSYGETEEKNE